VRKINVQLALSQRESLTGHQRIFFFFARSHPTLSSLLSVDKWFFVFNFSVRTNGANEEEEEEEEERLFTRVSLTKAVAAAAKKNSYSLARSPIVRQYTQKRRSGLKNSLIFIFSLFLSVSLAALTHLRPLYEQFVCVCADTFSDYSFTRLSLAQKATSIRWVHKCLCCVVWIARWITAFVNFSSIISKKRKRVNKKVSVSVYLVLFVFRGDNSKWYEIHPIFSLPSLRQVS
jgi:hypothetical protein